MKFAKSSLVKGRIFANPAAHPHPNYMGVPPGHLDKSRRSIKTSVASRSKLGDDCCMFVLSYDKTFSDLVNTT